MRDDMKIKEYLLKNIDEENLVQIEKVERYMNLLNIFYKLDKDIEEKGLTVETENGSQKFIKLNPAIAEKNKINTSLLAIEKSFNFEKDEVINDKPSDDYL